MSLKKKKNSNKKKYQDKIEEKNKTKIGALDVIGQKFRYMLLSIRAGLYNFLKKQKLLPIVIIFVNFLIAALSFYDNLYKIIWEYAKYNVVLLVIVYLFVLIGWGAFFYWNRGHFPKYKQIALLAFVLFLGFYNVILIFFALNIYLGKAFFINSTYLYFYFTLLFVGILFVLADVPLESKISDLYKISREFFYNEWPVVLALMFILVSIGVITGSFVFGLSAFFSIAIFLSLKIAFMHYMS